MAVALSDGPVVVHQGDVRECLRELADESVQCVVTSPPYWGLRDYGTAKWDGGDADCDHSARTGDLRFTHPISDKQRSSAGSAGSACTKCGARRTDSQLGLEATPEEYVASMVEVFREVRRVLRKDGTLWLNLGDSYASHDPGGRRAGEFLNPDGRPPVKGEARNRAGNYRPFGLKPKDLVGIPWRLAFALQQPYYTGRIKEERDRIWLAAMIDAEGCLFLHKRKIGQSNGQGYSRKADTYGAGLEIANTSESVITRCQAIVGRGSVFCHEKDRRQPLYRWNMRSNECREIIREVYPHLVAKQHQARLLLGCPSSGPVAEAAHAALIHLHNGVETSVDFPPPASMYEPGFYLRSDVIWSKANPMPESVTDRPTKAHEYLFLLTRSPRYYYDADAIREPNASPEQAEHNRKYAKVYDAHTARVATGKGIQPGNVNNLGIHARGGATEGRNRRSVWEVATQPYPEAHFATYPEDLVIPCIKAGTREGDVVLDPFAGSGTTLAVARRLGRRAVGIELNPEYVALIEKRVGAAALPLLEMSGRCG